MALTPAERMKKYREKLKADPQKYEEVKKKHAARVKNKSIKISELTEDDKEKRRKKWREQKRKQKINKTTGKNDQKISSTVNTETRNKKSTLNRNRLARKYNAAIKRILNLKTALETSRKKFYRYKKETNKKVQSLEETISKMKARDELLESCLKTSYGKCKKYEERNVFKTLTENETTKKLKKKTFVSKLLGLKGIARKTTRKTKENEISKEIRCFFLRDDISKSTSGKKESRTLKKQKEQIRYLTDTLFNVYKIYRADGGTKSFATFYKYRPFYVISPTVQKRDTCICIKHSNFEKMFSALQKLGVLTKYKVLENLLAHFTCNIKSKKCMYGECDLCKGQSLEYDIKDRHINEDIEWEQWENINHEYKGTKKGNNKTVKTKRMAKVRKTGNVETLIQNFKSNIPHFKKHYYNWKHQQHQYRKCITELKENEAVLLCDFSENYCGKLAEEVQSMHFGAAKQQFTLHTGMIYWAGGSQSFCSIADKNAHDPAAIWAHLLPVIKLAKEHNPMLKVIHFYSDGPCTQYRQKKNFFLHNLFTFKLGLEYSTWSFTESGHGKSVADGIGGTVKRSLDKQVAYGNDVSCGKQAVELLSKCMKSVKCLYIIDSDIDNINKLVPEDLKALTGTMQTHQVIAKSPGEIQYRPLSCFCGFNRGLCDCFGLRIHAYGKPTQQTELSSSNLPSKVTITAEIHAMPILSSKKVVSMTSKQKNKITGNLEEIEDIIEVDIGSDKGQEREKQERVEEIYFATFNCREREKEKIGKEVCGNIIGSEEKEQQDKGYGVSGAALDSIIIPLEKDLLFDLNNFVEMCDLSDNLEVLGETDVNVEDRKVNITDRKRHYTQEEKSDFQVQKTPKLNKENNFPKKQKSIRNVVSRHSECHKCKIRTSLQLMKKCIACKNVVCFTCHSGIIPKDYYNDFICDICFGG